jgi:hypothetical protein
MALTSATVAAAIVGWLDVAAVLAGMLVVSLAAAVIQVRRRVDAQARSLADQSSHVVQRLEFFQRQMLSVIEAERLAAHDRYEALLAAIHASRDAGERPGGATPLEVQQVVDSAEAEQEKVGRDGQRQA